MNFENLDKFEEEINEKLIENHKLLYGTNRESWVKPYSFKKELFIINLRRSDRKKWH